MSLCACSTSSSVGRAGNSSFSHLSRALVAKNREIRDNEAVPVQNIDLECCWPVILGGFPPWSCFNSTLKDQNSAPRPRMLTI